MHSPTVQTIRGYELRERIGTGGFGAVYRAYQPAVDRQVAVKVILPALANHPDFIRRFETEAQLVARVEHPYIVPLYDYWREPDGAYLVMRWLRGGNLREALQRGPWPPEAAAGLLDQVAGALAVAHRQGVVHRDVKPENILLDEEGRAYLTDFGIAKDLLRASQTETDAITGSLSYISPEQARSESVTPQSDLYSLGVVLYELLTGEHPFPGVTPATQLVKHLTEPLPSLQEQRPDLPVALDDVIQRATAKDPTARYPDALALAADFRAAVAGATEAPAFPLELVNPYKGLRAFAEADAGDFFGRAALVERLLTRLTPSPTLSLRGGGGRFLAVVGPSGSGKSSAVKAGLLPALRRGALPGSGQWFVVEMQPGAHPLDELELGLLQVAVRQPAGLMEQLQRDERGLLRAARLVLPSNGELLLVVDQFEELFTRATDSAESEHLLELLHVAATNEESPVHVVVTLRADFYDRPLLNPALGPLLREHTEVVLPLTPEELAQAIQAPAERAGAEFEPGLVAAIVADVSQQPGALPMLQYALTELFERREGRVLTHAAYQASGGVAGALAQRAEAVFAGLDEVGQAAARQAFLRLVTLGEGVEDTRRRVLRGELTALMTDERQTSNVTRRASTMDTVLDVFGRSRLLQFDRDVATRAPTVEVAHEALLREWGRLREWLDESRADVRQQRLLAAAAEEWAAAGHDPGYLLYGTRLAQFEGWAAGSAVALTGEEQAYLAASIEAREAREAAEEARRQHELEQARALAEEQQKRAEEQTRSASRLRRRAVYLGVALVVALAATIAAGVLGYLANEQRQAALAQAAILLASQAESELADGYYDRAVLLALEALENYPYTSQAEHALGQAVSYSRALQQYTAHQSAVTSVAWSPDGTRVASSCSTDNNVHIWDPATGQTLRVIAMPTGITGNKTDMALCVQWTPDGQRLLTLTGDRYWLGSQDYDVLLWNADTGQLISSVEITNQAQPESGEFSSYVKYVTGAAAAIASQSGRLATLGGDNTALIWDGAYTTPTLTLTGHTNDVNSVAWSPDEKKLATASLDGTARIWDVETGTTLHILKGHEGRVNLAAWSPDGASLATAGEDGTVRIWDAANGDLARSLPTNVGEVTALVWAPPAGGQRIVTGHTDSSIRIWEAGSGKLLETLRGHPGLVTDLKWSPLDDCLASGDGNGFARIWNAAFSTAWRVYPPQAARGGDWTVQGADWSSDGRYLVMAGGDVVGATEPASFCIWDVSADTLLMEHMVDKLHYMGSTAHFSPDDQAILYTGYVQFPDFSGCATAHVFDAQSGEIIRTFTPGGDSLIAPTAWSPDGSQVATGLFTNQVIIWDYATGQPITRLVKGEQSDKMVDNIEWSPDGSRFAASGDDSTARVWDAHTWQPLYTVHHQPPAAAIAVAWSPDSTRLLTTAGLDEIGAKDTTVRIWDGATGKELLVFAGHTKMVWSGSWSPNGQRVVTGSGDGAVRVWDASTGVELLTLSVPTIASVLVSWSPDGQHLAVFGNETLVSVWRVWQSTADLLTYAKQNYVIRELTDAEREQFGLAPR